MDASAHRLGNLGASRVQGVVDIEPDNYTVILSEWSDNQPAVTIYICIPVGITGTSDMMV